jgi:hypothetical protein
VKTLLAGLALAAILVTPPAVGAVVLAESTFDNPATTNEGWRVGTLFSASAVDLPFWLFDASTSNGWIEADGLTEWLAFAAPAAFLGDQSSAYGGSLTFDLRLGFMDPGDRPLVVLSDGTTELQFRSVAPPLFVFTAFDVPLLAAAGWQLSDGTGAPGAAATEAQLQEVLSGLTRLRILIDWHASDGGDDITDLDNVSLIAGPTAVPAPATLTLAILGAGVAALLARRRRRR